MSSRSNYYTATIKVPVYASWKCEHCGEINFAEGIIACSRSEYTGSFITSRIRAVQDKASLRAQLEWAECALKIIDDPNGSGSEIYNNFTLRNASCTQCGRKPSWDTAMAELSLWTLLGIPVALICGILIVENITNIAAWFFFIAGVIVLVWGLTREKAYIKMMSRKPAEYTPVFGSLNPELVRFAKKLGKPMPTPDECVAAVRGYNHIADGVQPLTVTTGNPTSESNTAIPANYCRKCRTQLQAGSDSCHKCGTEIIRQL